MPATWRRSCCPRPSASLRRSAACSGGLPRRSSRRLRRPADAMPDVLMPKLSDTMEEGRIIRWYKHQGDRVAIGDVLAEVETDKANMELEAFDEGTLAEVRTAEGESAPVGAVIAVLSEAGADAKAGAAETPEKGAPKPAAATAPAGAKKPQAAEEP